MLTIEGGSITVEDTIGRRIFDSAERMFHFTDTLIGSKSFTAYVSGVGSNVSVDTTHVLGSCHADATHVQGAIGISYAGSTNPSGIPASGRFNMSGTYIHWFDGSTFTTSGFANNPNLKSEPNIWSQFTPRVAGGQFLLDQKMFIFGYTSGGIASNYTQYAFTMNYRFKAGLFTV